MDREQIVQLNNNIALHANRKELDEAMALFKQALDDGSANSHTYAAALNANIRCGKLEGAESVLEVMKKKGRKRDVIICTTMIKGYCQAGKVSKAMDLFNDMTEKKPKIEPNIRTINTILRGCVQTGDVATAEALVMRAQKDFKLPLDVSSWEHLTALLSQSLKLDKALPVVGRLKDDPAFASGQANLHLSLARAAAFLGDWKVCKRSIAASLAAIDTSAPTAENDGEATALSVGKNTGGKRAKNAEGQDATRVQSLELYQEHNKGELKAELAIIEAFMEKQKASNVPAFQYVFPFYLRLFPFNEPSVNPAPVAAAQDDSGKGKKKDTGLRKELVKPIMRSIEANFGLEVFAKRLTTKTCDELNGYALHAPVVVVAPPKSKKQKLKEKELAAKKAAADTAGDSAAVPAVPVAPVFEKPPQASTPEGQQVCSFRALTAKAFDNSGRFSFANVFPPNKNGASAGAVVERPVKIEVCSGAGEWAVAQAKQDTGADWVTLELRHDRAYQIFTKAVFADVQNLCVLCGDAMQILPSHFPSNAVTNIFVNHPEPPQQTGGHGMSQSRHLLEQSFFLEAARILKPGGTLTIVTDNLWYGRLLTRLVANISLEAYSAHGEVAAHAAYGLQSAPAPSHRAAPGAATNKDGPLASEWAVQESEGDVVLYVGKPGAAAGHVVEASSYFDRLWKRGNLVERYFLVLRKVDASGMASAAHAASKKRPIAMVDPNKPINVGGVSSGGKNSRIKFD